MFGKNKKQDTGGIPVAKEKKQGSGTPVAKAKKAGKTNKKKGSVVECKVEQDCGEWITPNKGKSFYIDEESNFPEITFEIKSDKAGPYSWSWKIMWKAMSCPQKKNKKRFTPSGGPKIFTAKGAFTSNSKSWEANLNNKIIGGILTVKVTAGNDKFVRNTKILGKNPSESLINTELDTYTNKKDAELVKKIFKQESRYRQFYTDEMPLVSFDKGFGLGQLTNPAPTYEQAWCWKKHVKAVMDTIHKFHRVRAQDYLDQHGNYTDDMLDLETLASYNGLAKGQRYHNWDSVSNKWVVNTDVTCDPDQSNKGWLMTKAENKNKSLEELRAKNAKSKPFYTGRCYAEHIKNNQ